MFNGMVRGQLFYGLFDPQMAQFIPERLPPCSQPHRSRLCDTWCNQHVHGLFKMPLNFIILLCRKKCLVRATFLIFPFTFETLLPRRGRTRNVLEAKLLWIIVQVGRTSFKYGKHLNSKSITNSSPFSTMLICPRLPKFSYLKEF